MKAFEIPEAPPWFTSRLKSLLEENGISLSEEQLKKIKLHAEWLFYWNKSINLTAVKSWEEAITKHYLSSIIPAVKWLPKTGKALDIGSGAGFPGIPLKIVSPELDITLCDSKRKKVNFLRLFVTESGLKGIRVEQRRWEEIIDSKERFDLITARAIKFEPYELAYIVEQGLQEKGVMALWLPSSKLERLSETKGVDLKISKFKLFAEEERTVVLLQKSGTTFSNMRY